MSTIKELKTVAKNLGITRYSKMNRSELEKTIKRVQNPGPNQIINPYTNYLVDKNGKIGQKILKNSKVIYLLYTKKGCIYCEKAKQLLTEKNIKYKIKEVTDENKEKVYKKIDSITEGYRSFPVVIIKNGSYNSAHCSYEFVGGYTELEKRI